MFVDPQAAVSTALGWIREVSIIGAIVLLGWKSRSVYQNVVDFTEAIQKHMTTMESFAFRLEYNHLVHIEQATAIIARSRSEKISRVGVQDVAYAPAEENLTDPKFDLGSSAEENLTDPKFDLDSPDAL